LKVDSLFLVLQQKCVIILSQLHSLLCQINLILISIAILHVKHTVLLNYLSLSSAD